MNVISTKSPASSRVTPANRPAFRTFPSVRSSLSVALAVALASSFGVACSAEDAITGIGSGASGGSASGGSGGSGTTAGSSATAGSSSSSGATSVGGSGGASSEGGSGGQATGGSGGAAGGSGGAAGGEAPTGNCTGDCTAVFGKFDGWANLDPPASVTGPDGIQGPGAKDNVPTAVCAASEQRPDHGLLHKEAHWQLKGPGIEAGKPYKVVVGVTGVVECKTYSNIGSCPRSENKGRGGTYNLFCPGGTDPPLTSQPDHYNTVMLSVTPTSSPTTPNLGPQDQGPLPTEGNWWMLNECPQGVNEFHLTWKMDYEATITVPGESWVNFVEFDTNCREIINCGDSDDAAKSCTTPFTIQPQGAVPAPPASITTQPAAAGGGKYGQWLYFDVKSVTKM
jgi:hypothetical protein